MRIQILSQQHIHTQNLEFKWGENGISYVIGRRTHSGYEGSGDMQIADAHYVSGYAYDATAFGYFEDQTGIWKPKNTQEVMEVLVGI